MNSSEVDLDVGGTIRLIIFSHSAKMQWQLQQLKIIFPKVELIRNIESKHSYFTIRVVEIIFKCPEIIKQQYCNVFTCSRNKKLTMYYIKCKGNSFNLSNDPSVIQL